MISSSPALHMSTPTVSVTESTGAQARELRFLRHPDRLSASEPASILISRNVNEPMLRTVRLYGARQLQNADGLVIPDAISHAALDRQALMTHTADGDESYSLVGIDGQPIWARNAQGTVNVFIYEGADTTGRLLSVTETAAGSQKARTREKLIYGESNQAGCKARNLAGVVTRRYDNAGYTDTCSIALTKQSIDSAQYLLKLHEALPDWAAIEPPETEAALTQTATYDATGAVLTSTNSEDVTAATAYDITGALHTARLKYTRQNSPVDLITLRDIVRQPNGAVITQSMGNGLTELLAYDPRAHHLTRHTIMRPSHHRYGPLVISDLHYVYDPVGNILTLDDKGADPQWHRNQQATGLRSYAYDTLYRLAAATGRERVPVAHYGVGPSESRVWVPYTEIFSYDHGDNLALIRHLSGAGDYTRKLAVAEDSNRAIIDKLGQAAKNGFWAGGLQKQLSNGQALSWYADNQLYQVAPVRRSDGELNDTERYLYADGGTRSRKIQIVQVACGLQTSITTYSAGCERRQRRLANALQKDISITTAGDVRFIENKLTGEPHLRYAFTDRLGSCGGEADEVGRITSREEFSAYGDSAGSDEESTEITDRTVRYAGNERDATGLYYYGWRYYQAELGRWLSADPGELIDGANLFRFCRNNPIRLNDPDGRDPHEILQENFLINVRPMILSRNDLDYDAALGILESHLKLTGQALGESMVKIMEYFHEAPRSINTGYVKVGGYSDDYVKNMFSTGARSNSSNYIDMRFDTDSALVNIEGANPALKELYFSDDFKVVSSELAPAHPTYGAIQMHSLELSQGGAPIYGSSAFFLTDDTETMRYLSYTPQDSFRLFEDLTTQGEARRFQNHIAAAGNMYPLIRYATPEQLDFYEQVIINEQLPHGPLEAYIEWQSHGRLLFGKDIEHLAIAESEVSFWTWLNGSNRAVDAFTKSFNVKTHFI
ncbi:RHS repeat-associated core domain-containing protein [Pseudomonas putida]|uniref:RHS repeat-associated core domain-containing protein n=1 Tax=Pseudomonas putida TaxID=303 RepID=A0A6I6XHE6_PSEPU|nr:RHS repeat-associated core domain-containing protein [Pseudomonas putida]QHG65151.2 RHS repeat-associated core domain-containing protein [Pseudomonas putida]